MQQQHFVWLQGEVRKCVSGHEPALVLLLDKQLPQHLPHREPGHLADDHDEADGDIVYVSQVTSDSSIDGYIRALKAGCRCVEVNITIMKL